MTAPDAAPVPLLNLHEYETAARALLPPMVVDYVAGGSGDEVTLRGNRAAFDRWRLVPRVLRGLSEVSTATTVLGQTISLPVLVGPSGRHRLCHDEGERATARAAKTTGTIYTMSTAATLPIEEIAPEAGSWWFQLYVYRDRGLTRDLVARRCFRSSRTDGDRRRATAWTARSRGAHPLRHATRSRHSPSHGA